MYTSSKGMVENTSVSIEKYYVCDLETAKASQT